jgi:hypothetical protein
MKLRAALPLQLVLFGCLWTPVQSVRAFSDPASFGLAALAAGGGGRFFTGSPADGYTCKACHEGGPEPKVSVLGLPLAGYRPGMSYEISVIWPSQVEKFGAAIEVTDMRGQPAGSLQLPSAGEAQPPEFCEPASEQVLAAVISQAPNQRQVIQLPDCGARRIRFLWTAPRMDSGPVWFAGSAVWSDGEADPYHDGVTDFGRVLASPAVSSVATQNCSVSVVRAPGAGHVATRYAWGVCMFCGFARRALRRREKWRAYGAAGKRT